MCGDALTLAGGGGCAGGGGRMRKGGMKVDGDLDVVDGGYEGGGVVLWEGDDDDVLSVFKSAEGTLGEGGAGGPWLGTTASISGGGIELLFDSSSCLLAALMPPRSCTKL